MLRNKNYHSKTDSNMRTGKSAGRPFASGLQETHEFAEKVTVWNLVERWWKIELRPCNRQDDKYNVKQIKRTDKHKNSLVNQFFIKEITPERRSKKDEIIGKVSEIHQFAKPWPWHPFTELNAWLATEQYLVGFNKLMI